MLQNKPEPFAWVAILDDGSHIQMGDMIDGQEISTSHLNADRVTMIRLFPLTPEGRQVDVHINLTRGERFIRFWRQFIVQNSEDVRINVVGIQAHDGTEYRLYVYPDGRVVMSSQDLYGELLTKE